MKIIGSPTTTPMNPKKAGGPATLKVTVRELTDGGYGADTDPDVIQKAIEDNRTVVCYWFDKNIMLNLTYFQFGVEYIFTALEGTTQYSVVIRDTEDIVCTETKLAESDDLPTGGGSNYRLIAKIVFDETNLTNTIVITQDMDGKPLELTKLFMYANWKAREDDRSDSYLSINNGAKASSIFNVETTAYKSTAEVDAFDGFYCLYFTAKIEDKAPSNVKTYVRDMTGSKINHIRWYTNANREPPVGSTLTVYGY